jgi:hypothetical protein
VLDSKNRSACKVSIVQYTISKKKLSSYHFVENQLSSHCVTSRDERCLNTYSPGGTRMRPFAIASGFCTAIALSAALYAAQGGPAHKTIVRNCRQRRTRASHPYSMVRH